jgi:hypothetical protein
MRRQLRKTLLQLLEQAVGPYILARQNHQADEQKQYALQDWQKEASDTQEDESPAGQQYQPPLALLIQLVFPEVWRSVFGRSGDNLSLQPSKSSAPG